MTDSPSDFIHTIEYKKNDRVLIVNRLYPDGRLELYTSVGFPEKSFDEDKSGFRAFAQTLGENLLIDSFVARALLGL